MKDHFQKGPLSLSILSFFITFLSCTPGIQHRYAIRDFRDSLRPALTEIVSKGALVSDTTENFIGRYATDEELTHLSLSEHPVLRALALGEMLTRKKFNALDVLLLHLDDTAIVGTDGGEWGIIYKTVSDHLIDIGKWENEAEKKRTIDKVIKEHNYLKSAYTILTEIEPNPEYYPHIKVMLSRERPFREIENHLSCRQQYYFSPQYHLVKLSLICHVNHITVMQLYADPGWQGYKNIHDHLPPFV
ncbi:MAG TPA: hypothetical protein VE035_10305 [Puia sp.]|nr:hypothetical protein [Puia sp.]